MRVGDWAWARAAIDEALATDRLAADVPAAASAEYHADMAALEAISGGDASQWLVESERLAAELTDTQYESYRHWAEAWAHLAAGRDAEAGASAEQSARLTIYFRLLAWPISGRAAIWAGDLDRARSVLADFDDASLRGAAIELDHAGLRAGVAGLEGRSAEALAGYRTVIKGFSGLGLAFDAALATIDLVSVIPPADRTAPEIAALIDDARGMLNGVGAQPFLNRLDRALGVIPPAARPIRTGAPVLSTPPRRN
jgi:hypothetical protein